MHKEKWNWERVVKISNNANCKLITPIDENIVINNKTKVTWLCKCGRETFTRRVANFNQGQTNCSICVKEIQRNNNKLNYKDVNNYIKSKGYVLLSSKYNTAHRKIKLKCKHGHIFNMSFSMFKSGQRCPECRKTKLSKMFSKGTYQYQKELDEIHNKNIVVVEEYINNNTKIKHKCKVCGLVWKTYPTTLLRGSGCRKCGKSKGERKVQNFLDNNRFNYVDEYSFDELVSDLGNPLRFDFAVFEGEEILCLIEYDGRYHFKKIYPNHNLERQKKHDRLKDKFAKDNDIPLIRIPYTQFENIDSILTKYLS